MFRFSWKLFAALMVVWGVQGLAFQTGSRERNESDRLRGEYIRAHRDFLALDPKLEQELLTAPPDQMLARVDVAQKAAEKQITAKRAYYESFLKTVDDTLQLLNTATKNPSEDMLEHMTKRRKDLQDEEAEATKSVEELRAQKEVLRAKGASAADIASLQTLIDNAEGDRVLIQKARLALENTMANAKDSMNAHRNLLPTLEAWKGVQEGMKVQYQNMAETARREEGLWVGYYNDLRQIVNQGRNTKQRKQE